MTKVRNRKKSSRLRLIITLVTFCAFGILIWNLKDEIAGVVDNLGNVNVLALLLLIPIQVINYDVYARFYRKLFAIFNEKVKYWFMYKLALELNFVNHILPSGGVSGVSYFSLRLKQRSISPAKSTLVQLLKFFILFLAFQPILVMGLIFLAAKGHVNNLVVVVFTTIVTLMIVGTWVGVYIIGSQRRIRSTLTFVTRIINQVVHFFYRRKPEIFNIKKAQAAFLELHENFVIARKKWFKLKRTLFFMMIANTTEILAIYTVYIAFGEFPNVGAVILAYAVANFAGLISVLPAGIGVYEGLMAAVLAATGIPLSLSIPVIIMYRLLNMTIQVTPGYFLYQKALKEMDL